MGLLIAVQDNSIFCELGYTLILEGQLYTLSFIYRRKA